MAGFRRLMVPVAGILMAAMLPGITLGTDASDGSSTTGTDPAASTDPTASTAPLFVNPYAAAGAIPDSGKGKRIGYISPSIEFAGNTYVKQITASIEEQADIAGAKLAPCSATVAYECFSTFRKGRVNGSKVKAAGGVIAFDIGQRESSFCSGYGKLPTIAIENSQSPCEVAFMGPDDHEAGRLGGAAMGRYAKDNWDCDVTAYVSLEAAAWPINTARMGGFRDGFGESCPIDPATVTVLDVAGRPDFATEQLTALLPTLPGDHIVVVAVNDQVAVGALDAARTLGREEDLFFASLGGDESIRKDVACDPQVIASVAYYPERYGRTVIPAMLDILAGKEVPARLYTVHEVLDATNIRDIYPETPAC